jgi:chorismate lyase
LLKRVPGWRLVCLPAHHPLYLWLSDEASLTARLAARCTRLTVQVLSQRLALPHPDEAAVLGLRPRERACVREVLLCTDGVAQVYARSIMPRSSLRSDWRLFGRIGNRPLGSALFADPLVSRSALQSRRFDARDARYHRAAAFAPVRAAQLWGRRSLFMRRGLAMIVCEIFLDDIGHLPR